MGRKYESSDSDGDDLPDLSTLLTVPKTLQQKPSQNNSSPTENDRDRPDSRSSSAPAVEYPILNKKASCDERRVTEHKPLRLAHVDPLLLPLTSLSLKPSEALTIKHNASKQRAEALRQLSKRLARKKSPRKYVESDSSDEEEEDASGKDESYEDVESTGAYKSEDGDLSDFIVNDSASEEELRRPRRTKENSLPSPSQTRRRRLYQKIDRRSSLSPGRNWVGTVLPNSKGKGENMEETKDKVNEPVQYPKLESFDEPDASLKL